MKISQGELTRFVEMHLQDYDCEHNPEELMEYVRELDEVSLFADALFNNSQKCGFSGNRDELDKLKQFIRNLILENTGIKENPANIYSWLKDTMPKRDKVYILCFAFKMNINQVFDFFVKAYLERPFNFRNLKETVYAFCFKNGLSYSDADRLIKQLKDTKNHDTLNEQTNTQQIGIDILGLDNESQLLDYCISNYGCFSDNSLSARNEIMSLLDSYGKKVARIDKEEYDRIDKELNDNKDRVTYEVASVRRIMQTIYGSNIRSQKYDKNDKKIQDKVKNKGLDNIPSKLRNNLPEEGDLNKLRNGEKTSDDTLRKCLIMFKFFDFFSSEEQEWNGETEECENRGYYKEFLGEMNMTLLKCGYGQIYIRNPYDWLFAYCAYQSDPIGTFNDIMEYYGFAYQEYLEVPDEKGEPRYKEVFR